MARPRIHRDWKRPDLDCLRTATVRQSLGAGRVIIDIDETQAEAVIHAGPGEIVISETMRDEIISYIERLETLIDERIGRSNRENPVLSPLQVIALDFEVAAGVAWKGNMKFGISAKELADKLSEAGHTGTNGISEDTIDAWRKLPAYRAEYLRRLVDSMGAWFRGEDDPADGAASL